MRTYVKIFLKSSHYPLQRYEAVIVRDIEKIYFEFFRRSTIKNFLRLYQDSSEDLKKNL